MFLPGAQGAWFGFTRRNPTNNNKKTKRASDPLLSEDPTACRSTCARSRAAPATRPVVAGAALPLFKHKVTVPWKTHPGLPAGLAPRARLRACPRPAGQRALLSAPRLSGSDRPRALPTGSHRRRGSAGNPALPGGGRSVVSPAPQSTSPGFAAEEKLWSSTISISRVSAEKVQILWCMSRRKTLNYSVFAKCMSSL